MMRLRFLISQVLFLIAMATPIGAFAQESPPADDNLGVTKTMTCTADPRDIDEILTLWFDSEGAPAPTPLVPEPVANVDDLPPGIPADEITINAISETTHDWFYCTVVVGQYARGFSYLTDDLIAQFGPDTGNPTRDSPEEVRTLLEGQLVGTPIPGGEGTGVMPPFDGPRDARLLDAGRIGPVWGGRAGALWTFGGDRVFIVYEQQGDRWLIDNIIDVVEVIATPDS